MLDKIILSVLAISLGSAPWAQAARRLQHCNNQSRTIQVPAGTTQTQTDCAVFSLTVLGQTFTSPPSCPNSRTVREEDTWSCGPAATDIHCNSNGYTVTVKQYFNESPCPGIPDTLPTTLAEANAAVQCQLLPLLNQFNVFSATVMPCNENTIALASSYSARDGEERSVGGENYVIYEGGLDDLPSRPWSNEWKEKLKSLQTLPADELPDVLSATLLHYPSMHGVTDLNATVTYDFWNVPEKGTVRNRHRVTGTLLAAGSFSLVEVGGIDTEDGPRELSVTDYYFDGSRFLTGQRGAEFYRAYLSPSPWSRTALQFDAQFAWPLIGWVDNPFWIPRIPGSRYESSSSNEETLTVVETYPAIQSFGRTEYLIDVASEPPRPVRIDTYDVRGALTRRREFGRFDQVDSRRSEVWRPMHVLETRYDPVTGSPTIRIRTEIFEARITEDAAELPAPRRRSDRWFLRV